MLWVEASNVLMRMKRILITLCLTILTTAFALAGSDIKMKSGDAQIMKTAEGNAVVTVVIDDAQYDNKMPLREKFSDLDNFKKVAEAGFTETFNDKSKNVKIVKNQDGAKYEFIINVLNVDQYIKVTGFIPSPATKIWGTLQIKEVATGKLLFEGEFAKINGGANPSPDGTISDSFEELAKQTVKLK